MQVKAQHKVGFIALDLAARRRRQRVLAVEPRAVGRRHQHAPVDHAEAGEIAVM